RLDTLVEKLAPHVALELAAVALLLEERLQPGAVEDPVLLQLGELRDGEEDLVLARRDAEAVGFVLDQRAVDELVERLPGKVERLGEIGRQAALCELVVTALQER